MKRITILLILLLSSRLADCQTNLSGTISIDSTLTTAGNPYIITGNLTIENGATLTVEPDVIVKFNNDKRLYIWGAINANQATFTANENNPSPGFWDYIQIGNSYNEGSAIFLDCIIEYGDKLFIDSGTASIDNCLIHNMYYYGIQTDDNLSMNNSTIQNCQYGIHLNTNGNVQLTDVTITMNEWPIYYYGPGAMSVSGNNNLHGNTIDAVYIGFTLNNNNWTLPNINNNATDNLSEYIPYYFCNSFTINETAGITIESNNIIKFFNGRGLNVKGKLIANANGNEFIYFTSYKDDNWGGDTNNDGTTSIPATEDWVGIIFQNESIDEECLLNKCKIRFAGHDYKGGINCYNAGPTIDSCDISNSRYGFYLRYASNPIITNNIIGSSALTPFAMSFDANPTFENNTLSSSDNQYDAIGLLGGELSADAILPIRTITDIENITYVLLEKIIIPDGLSLTIDPNVVIKGFDNDHYFHVYGKLISSGTEENNIVFTSIKDDNFGNPNDTNKDGSQSSPAVGNWGGFLFEPTSDPLSEITYSIIQYGEFPWYNYVGEIILLNASPTISNCEIKNVKYGIAAHYSSQPQILNNDFSNSEFTPFAMSLSAAPVFFGNTFYNCGLTALGLLGGEVGADGIISSRNVAGYENITYVIVGDITINSGTYIEVESGVSIKFNDDKKITVDGGFKISGTYENPVIFSSVYDDNVGNPADVNGDGNATFPQPGDWKWVAFQGTSDDAYCSINHAQIKFGGHEGGNIVYDNASGTISVVSISGSQTFGITCNGNSEPLINNLTIQNCSGDPVGMSLLSDPQFNNVIFTGNNTSGIRITDTQLSSNASLNKRSIAGIPNIAYIMDNLTINEDVVLEIEPGVVIKFPYYSSYWDKRRIEINGAIEAIAELDEKIVFTSIKDDSYGGDTNNDGATSVPEKGDWRSLNYNSSTIDTLNVLKNCIIRYGGSHQGSDLKYGMIKMFSSYVKIDSCYLEQSQNSGIGIFGNSSPEISNCSFVNLTLTPIYLSMFSNPEFNNNTMSNVGNMSIGVYHENWSQDDTIQIRDFAGYQNITYCLYSNYNNNITINNGTTIHIPQGIVFKGTDNSSREYLDIFGKIIINGTNENPVIFTSINDDDYGNPKDTRGDGSSTEPTIFDQYWLNFQDVSDDESEINNVIFKYQNEAVILNQASPEINNCEFSECNFGIKLNGVSTPIVNNCVFDNLVYTPLYVSLLSYPSSNSGNIISGSTYRAIGVMGETLSQDLLLPARNFADINHIPYYFHEDYTIGSNAILTIEPGVIFKFNNYSQKLTVNKALIAEGGTDSQNKIVFTDIRDDFYGGDTNADSTNTEPGFANYSTNPWKGIYFENESIDDICVLDNCVIRYAGNDYYYWNYTGGINLNSSNPTITNTVILNNRKGIVASGASNPLVNNCDIYNNTDFGIENVNQAFVINAENCWWGSNSGPTHSGNPGGTGDVVTDGVDYDPWNAEGATSPMFGDVSLNGKIQAYDAALILQYTVGIITLEPLQLQVADVSGNGEVMAYDASLILQYIIGMIPTFPVLTDNLQNSKEAYALLEIGKGSVYSGEDIKIPINIKNASEVLSSEIELKYDDEYLQFVEISLNNEYNLYSSIDENTGNIRIAFAETQLIESDVNLGILRFKTTKNLSFTQNVLIEPELFLCNEIDLTQNVKPGEIRILPSVEIPNLITVENNSVFNCYPNPFSENLIISYIVEDEKSFVLIEIFSLYGKKVQSFNEGMKFPGSYFTKWTGTNSNSRELKNGTYFIKCIIGNKTYSSKVNLFK